MDTFWSFGSTELDQFVDRKKFLGCKFLKTRIMETESNIGKLRFVDFIKASTSVSMKFTCATSITEVPTLLIIVTQDTKFSEYIANRMTGNNSDQNNFIQVYRLFQKCTLF